MNAKLHASIHLIVENQLAVGTETRVAPTLRLLLAEGLDRHDAVHAIGSVLSKHIYRALRFGDLATELSGDPNESYERELDELTLRARLTRILEPSGDTDRSQVGSAGSGSGVASPLMARRTLGRRKTMDSTLYEALLDSVPSPILFVDNEHVIRYMNKAARAGYYEKPGHGDLIGRSLFDCHSPGSVEEIGRIHARLLGGEHEVFLKVNKYGERVTVVGVRDASGCLLGYYERFDTVAGVTPAVATRAVREK